MTHEVEHKIIAYENSYKNRILNSKRTYFFSQEQTVSDIAQRKYFIKIIFTKNVSN